MLCGCVRDLVSTVKLRVSRQAALFCGIKSQTRRAIADVRSKDTAEGTVCANMFAPSYSVGTVTPKSVL
jgi:hypothetical protein